MAPKAKQQKKAANPATAPAPAPASTRAGSKPSISDTIVTAFALLAIAALASPISQANLSPVYGSIPSAIYHEKGITFTALLAYISKSVLKKNGVAINTRDWIAPISYWIPTIQWLLFQYSAKLGPQYGPIVTEALTFYPVLFLSFVSTSAVLDDLDLAKYGTRIAEATPAVVSYALFSFMEKLAISLLPQVIGTSDFFTRSGLQLGVATLSALLSRSGLLFFAVPAMLHTLFANPHHYSASTDKVLNATLARHNFTLLARHDSRTGYISVVQNQIDNFIALRCDHSLLGGEWLVTPKRRELGQKQRETIYSVFTMLESVRLIKTKEVAPDSEKQALFIGLGIGTSPKAFIAHGINTTVVELDPVVHFFATKYFDLPLNHTSVIQNAIPFVAKAAVERPASYDYIVHDVFTGGAEPTALFTIEFLQGLERLLKENGAIAINYAGDINLPPPRIILNTIFAVFPSCRIYRDTLPSESAETFLNMVVFCTKSLDPIEFRKASPEDHLGSVARQQFIPPDDGLEVKLAEIGGERKWKETDVLKRGEEHKVEESHNESAMKHWQVMRTVFPDVIWELW